MSIELKEQHRYNLSLIIISLVFLVFTYRLVELQLLSAEEYGTKSKKNSIRRVVKEPGRGTIYDRNKNILVDTRPAFSLYVTPNDFDEKLIPVLSKILDIDTSVFKERLNKGKRYSIFNPVKIKKEIDQKTLAFIEENQDKFPGVEILPEPKRTYTPLARMSHFLGYVKEISDEQIGKDSGYYVPGDYIGQQGLESTYEKLLRGIKGYSYILVDSKGRKIGKYDDGKMDSQPIDGMDLNLSIDLNLQILAETLLTNKKGAIVAIDPSNGEILAMASKPDYDLSLFSGVTPIDVWQSLNEDPSKPLFNRAALGEYPPGSIFKMVLATAALQEGVIDENWTANCGGAFSYGDKVFKCTHVHGTINVTRAIHQSCNIFFYNLMLKLNKEKGWSFWNKYASMFGFGKRTGVDIVERPGFIPTESWYDKVYGKNWGKGFLISLAIGQGEVSITPLQAACYCSTIANNGTYYKPHLVHSYFDKHSNTETLVPIEGRKLDISQRVLNIIRHGMYLAVNAPGGTGLAAQVPGIVVAGKTGTAQNPHGKNHAWFIGFAPFDNPKIAVAIIIENGGFGGTTSAPIASALIKQYLLNKDKKINNDFIMEAQKEINTKSTTETGD
ncbi:MAG TPA: penicillin-binding protein 2 [Ignavibacteria bacterium]